MPRVASLYLPQLPIERLRRFERSTRPPERTGAGPLVLAPPIDDDPGPCSVPRGGGWRPGARWARDGGPVSAAVEDQITGLPAHQRPTMQMLGRRSEPAGHPFRAMPADEGVRAPASKAMPMWSVQARPTVTILRSGQREVLGSVCPVALDLGLRPGMAAAHARALVADLDLRDAEPEADIAFLDRLALHAVRCWTPTASVTPPDGLWLELSGTTHLFGGEDRFCRRLLYFLRRLGFTATIAIAGTPGAAYALARYGGDAITVLVPGAETQALAELPLGALRLVPDALAIAARLGLERIGDLYAMPRGPLARRLGLATVERLDQARGLVAEPVVPIVPFEAPRAERRLLEPIGTTETIAQVIGDLVDDLALQLERRGLGLRVAVLGCVVVDGGLQRIVIGAARATRDPAHLKRMLGMRIERIEPGLGIEMMTLAAPRVEHLAPTMGAGALGDDGAGGDIAELVDQLGGRVGEGALFRLGAVESDVPERAVQRLAPLAEVRGWPEWTRPARMLPRPELLAAVVALLPDHPPKRFQWRGRLYTVVAGDGPERIHGEWWRNARELWAVRDYFRVETAEGERFWLFRRGDGVEAETGDLSWYLHGLFG